MDTEKERRMPRRAKKNVGNIREMRREKSKKNGNGHGKDERGLKEDRKRVERGRKESARSAESREHEGKK